MGECSPQLEATLSGNMFFKEQKVIKVCLLAALLSQLSSSPVPISHILKGQAVSKYICILVPLSPHLLVDGPTWSKLNFLLPWIRLPV